MASNLTRDAGGRILSNNSPIILRGGQYYLFKNDDKPERCLVKPGEKIPFMVQYNGVPCQSETFTVSELMWEPQPWAILFDHLNSVQCNLLRVWLTGGTLVTAPNSDNPQPLDLTPFVGGNVGGKWKWQVFNAVVNDTWNNDFFNRLSSFAAMAESRGVNLQISLFNYLDLTRRLDDGDFKAWCRSPWNPKLSDNPPDRPHWGDNHLVNAGGSFACTDAPNADYEAARQTFFLAPTNGLRQVQQALVRKTVQTLAGRTNIIFEVMNEPRGTHEQAAQFSSVVIDWILAAAGSWRPLISVNASNLYAEAAGQPNIFDTDWWRDSSVPNYDKVDAISYHGLTGFPPASQAVCTKTDYQNVPRVDPGRIKARFDRHTGSRQVQGHPTKALIYSTDAVRVRALHHTYRDANGVEKELQVRDGQIYTNYPNDKQDTPENQRIKSDLQNWAYWCFSLAVKHQGVVHFHNQSMNQRAFRRIIDGFNAANAAPMTLTAAEQPEMN